MAGLSQAEAENVQGARKSWGRGGDEAFPLPQLLLQALPGLLELCSERLLLLLLPRRVVLVRTLVVFLRNDHAHRIRPRKLVLVIPIGYFDELVTKVLRASAGAKDRLGALHH